MFLQFKKKIRSKNLNQNKNKNLKFKAYGVYTIKTQKRKIMSKK